MLQIKIQYWYGYYDEEEKEDCMDGDYSGVRVIIDDKVLKEYGDHYHDKGAEKAKGFVDGYTYNLSESEYVVEEAHEAEEYD